MTLHRSTRSHGGPGRKLAVACMGLLVQACALQGLVSPGDAKEAQTKRQSRPHVALLQSHRADEQITARTRQLARQQDLQLARSEAGYYIDVQEAQLRRRLRHTSVGLARRRDSITLRVSGTAAFDTDSSRLKANVQPELTAISSILSEYRKTFVIVNSHTDKQGEADHNRRLSERRAVAVAQFLVRHGVEAERVAAVGHGESAPLRNASAGEDRWSNRRIEIRLEPITATY